MKVYRLLPLFLVMVASYSLAVRQQPQQTPTYVPILVGSPVELPRQRVNVTPKGEYLYEGLLGGGKESLYAVTAKAHSYLFGDKDNLKCFIFREECTENDQEALNIIYGFLSSEPIAPLLTRQNMKQRIATAGEVLREYYEIPHQFASLSNAVQNLMIQGHRESNWMDRRLKREVNKIMGGYDTVSNNERLMKYVTHFYFGAPPTQERIERMKKILNPAVAPRTTGFQQLLSSLWGAPSWAWRQVKRVYDWQRERSAGKQPVVEQPVVEQELMTVDEID